MVGRLAVVLIVSWTLMRDAIMSVVMAGFGILVGHKKKCLLPYQLWDKSYMKGHLSKLVVGSTRYPCKITGLNQVVVRWWVTVSVMSTVTRVMNDGECDECCYESDEWWWVWWVLWWDWWMMVSVMSTVTNDEWWWVWWALLWEWWVMVSVMSTVMRVMSDGECDE